ncbi:aspartyl protease family protein [Shewanella litorisediminis]|uniref:Aspartyl protease family protein n=1 Tax=Shewanella litorisediminis TaxID=1173586 RepID=A0ABX7G2D5_9GAMM|nr:aspartyl protease family protein [Shewanella litorisediminis]MCL2917021.1 aspartyl protease family protein [Shewanella litorisediminis]QRH01502.1 aspartyl protease family protein [Shewanella litorisediminis]
MKKPLISLVVVGCLLAGCGLSSPTPSPAAPVAISLPLKFTDKGHAYVYAGINGVEDYPLILDTAAQKGVLPESLKSRLTDAGLRLETTEVQTATGAIKLEEAEVEEVRLAGYARQQLDFLFRDMDELTLSNGLVPGIVGHNFLAQFCVAANLGQGALMLADSACPDEWTRGLKAVPFEIRNEFIWTKATFEGVEVDVLLDTGAPKSYMNSALLSLLQNVEQLESDSTQGLSGATQSRLGLANVQYQLGSHQVTDPGMYQADLHVFNQLGYAEKPFLLLGLAQFSKGRLVIDYHRQQFFFG